MRTSYVKFLVLLSIVLLFTHDAKAAAVANERKISMKRGISSVVMVMTLMTFIAATGLAREVSIAPVTLSKGLACLASQKWVKDDLGELGFRSGEAISIRFETGSIPGTSPETPNNTNVLFLSPGGRSGWLLFFRVEQDETITAIRNGYRVRRTKEGWTAGEGNGGIATYKAMSLYVGDLSRKPIIKLTLEPSTGGCQVE